MSLIITAREIAAIRTALSFALAGEPDDAWVKQVPHMQSALDKLGEQSADALIPLTKSEARQLLGAVGQMTDGNARSYDEWRQQTHGTKAQWAALIRGEAKLAAVRAGAR